MAESQLRSGALAPFPSAPLEQSLHIPPAEAPVSPLPQPVGREQAVIAPVPHRVDMHVEQFRGFLHREQAGRGPLF